MESIANRLQAKAEKVEKKFLRVRMSEVFMERKGYLNEFSLFLVHFNTIPNFIEEVKIDCKKANEWFFENYKSEIKDTHFDKRYFLRCSKKAEYDDIFTFYLTI